jgi:gluconate kinase
VVVILTDAAGARTAAIGRSLAHELGWPLVEEDDPQALHVVSARVLGRREHAVIAALALSASDRETVRGELRNVRFVDLAQQAGASDTIVRAIRREFGI